MYKYELILEIYFLHPIRTSSPMKGYTLNSQYVVENKIASRLSATREQDVRVL
jgi:hypothetical protein